MVASEQDVREKVQHYLAKNFRIGLEPSGMFSIDLESTRGFVTVLERGDRVIVKVEAVVAFRVPETDEMYAHVGRTSGDFLFGHLAVHANADAPGTCMVLFSHALLGNVLDEDELINAVIAVVGTANEVDDDFVAKFGGETFHG